MKDTPAQDDGNREGEWPAEGDTRFPVFEAVPSKSGRGRRRRGGLRGRERREGSVGRRETSDNQTGGGGDEKDEGAGRSSKESSNGRSSSVPPLQRPPVDPWAEAPALWQLFGS